jgi:hypothetical protein
VRHCSQARTPEAAENVVQALLAEGVEVDLEALRRNLYASSSCGICGKATLENALAVAPPLDDPSRFPASFFYGLTEQLCAEQTVFSLTGGLHGAALFGGDGRLIVAREDVGRHNAVDTVVGMALRSGRLPLQGHVLLVSGRSVRGSRRASAGGAHPGGGCRVGAVVARRGAGQPGRPHAGGVPARAIVQRVRRARTDRRLMAAARARRSRSGP